MKDKVSIFGIIALAAVIAFSMVGCTTDDPWEGYPTPTADDYEFGNLLQLVGNVTHVTITPKSDRDWLDGKITIYYNGETTLPSAVNTYTVTFDVAESNYWQAATGLSAGTLTVRGPFTSISDLNTWLSAAPANTKTTPYKIPLNVVALGGASSETGSVGKIFDNNKTKYVELNLSGSTITSIEADAFSGCESLTGITLPDGVTSIGNNGFSNCSGLTSITLPDTLTSIGNNGFSNCISLASITLPAGLTIIAQNTFLNCRGLTSITLPDTLTSIRLDAFSNCRSLTSIIIPASVTSITYAAFYRCEALTAINVDTANTAYSSEDGVLYNKAKTELHTYPLGKGGAAFTIPNSVTSIGQNAFDSCDSLTSITIPANVLTINPRAFQYCANLASVTIADCDVNISTQAFAGCAKLTSVTFAGDDVGILFDNAFPSGSSLMTAYASGKAGTYTLSGTTWSKQP